MSQGHLERNVAVLSHDELVFLWDLAGVALVLEGEIYDPSGEQEAEEQAEEADTQVGHIPASRSLEVPELPETEEYERDVAEPEGLVDCPKTNPSLEDTLRKPSEFVPLVDPFVLEQGDQDSPGRVEAQNEEVMTAGDEESCVCNSEDIGRGGGRGYEVLRGRAGQRVGQELEVEVFEVKEETAEVVGQGLVHEVVEVDHLEDLRGKEERI